MRLEAVRDAGRAHMRASRVGDIIAIERDGRMKFTAYKVLNDVCAGV
jgi:hypothetical protein